MDSGSYQVVWWLGGRGKVRNTKWMWALGDPTGLASLPVGAADPPRAMWANVRSKSSMHSHSKSSLRGDNNLHVEAILHGLKNLIPGLTFPYLLKRFFKSVALVVEESPLTQKFLPQLLRPITKKVQVKNMTPTKSWVLKKLKIIPNQTLSLLVPDASSTQSQLGCGAPPTVLTQALELRTRQMGPLATPLTMASQRLLSPWESLLATKWHHPIQWGDFGM